MKIINKFTYLYLISVIFLIFSGFLLVIPTEASGIDLYSSGDYSGAISAFEQDLSGVSGVLQAPILNNIGTCYVALGDANKAVLYYARAVEADPSYGRGWINLGVVQEKLGNVEDAISSYDTVDMTDPTLYAEAKVKKGSLLAALGEYSKALNSFNLAKDDATGTTVVDLYSGIGAVEFLQKNITGAEEAFQQAITTAPDGAALAYTNLGVLRITQGRYDEARDLLETAIQNDKFGQTNAKAYLEQLAALIREE